MDGQPPLTSLLIAEPIIPCGRIVFRKDTWGKFNLVGCSDPPGSWRMEMQTLPSLSMLGCHISVRILHVYKCYTCFTTQILYIATLFLLATSKYVNIAYSISVSASHLSTGGLRGYSFGKRRWHLKMYIDVYLFSCKTSSFNSGVHLKMITHLKKPPSYKVSGGPMMST